MAQDPDQVDMMHREAESADGLSGSTVLNVTFQQWPTSINQGSNFNLTIYPNPTEENVYITNPSTGKFSYSIYSVTGKLITSRDNISGSRVDVDLSSFAKGMYLVDVKSEEKTVVNKLIVK